jgi:hypothetical protein
MLGKIRNPPYDATRNNTTFYKNVEELGIGLLFITLEGGIQITSFDG